MFDNVNLMGSSLVSHISQIWQLSITTACKHGVIITPILTHFDWKKFTVLRLYAIHNPYPL